MPNTFIHIPQSTKKSVSNTKDKYESTLLAYQKRQDERKSETREKAKELCYEGRSVIDPICV